MTALELKNFETPSIAIVEEAVKERDLLILQASDINEVDGEFMNECAVEILRDIRKMKANVEGTRKSLKNPVLELGREIDGASKGFMESLLEEERRVKKLVDGYAAEQRRIRLEAERKHREEEQRIAREKEEAVKKMEEAESREEKEEARSEVEEKVKREADMKSDPVKHEPKPRGFSVKVSKDFEIVDIMEVLKARPDLVNVMPKRSAILEAIKTADSIPGLKIFEKTSTSIRK